MKPTSVKTNFIDGAVAFLIYDFIQIMDIGDWEYVKNSPNLMIIWHVVNATLCTDISWWILKDRINWKRKPKMAKDWIQGAIKHKGSLTRTAKEHGGYDKQTGKIKKSFIKKAASGKFGEKTERRADLAKTLSKLRKR